MKLKPASLITAFAIIIFTSCSVSKEARSMKRHINGDWVLETITAEGITGVVKTRIFNEEDLGCFIGSEWNFISNNSMGTYTLVDKSKSCTRLKRFIRWSIYEPEGAAKEFQFKRLDDNKNAMDNGDGYRLTVIEANSNTLKLRSDLVFDGKSGALIYNFVKK
jgi:Lipocalin-like domain